MCVLLALHVPTISVGRRMKRVLGAVVAVALTVGGVTYGVGTATAAGSNADEPCVETTAVPASYGEWSAWTVTQSKLLTEPTVPANTDTHEYRVTGPVQVSNNDKTEDTSVTTYQHYSHAHNEGDDPLPNDGVPPTPEQDPSQWQANTKSEPNGHYGHMYQPDGSKYEEGETGLHYASHGSSGRRDWFYLGATTVVTPGHPETFHPEWGVEERTRTFTPAVPAVDCPETPTETPSTPTETPSVPTETPSVTPPVETPTVTPEPTEEPTPVKPPKSTPQPPKDVQVIACVNGVWTTQVNGETISESGSCVEDEENTTFQTFSETGL
jgi:hypothetical protein